MSKSTKKKGAPRIRSPSASEIARNVGNFETWSTYQGCEQVSYFDLPKGLKTDVAEVFDVNGRLPAQWVDKVHQLRDIDSAVFTEKEVGLCILGIRAIPLPALFSDKDDLPERAELFTEVVIVHSAWRRLQRMRKSKEKWSEADFVANVYNVFRSPAVRESTHRVHCTISLPQPLPHLEAGTQSLRILNTKTVIPDCAIFLPAVSIRSLSHSAKSPFKVLKAHPSVTKTGTSSGRTSFRFQSTPCSQLPDTPGFEFASSFWEDKKPVHQLLEDAYRQNRMATTSAVRHLHSLRINAPVIGLVWSNGTVRAHVDWCKSEGEKGPISFSAPYPGQNVGEVHDLFHEWILDQPSDIMQVYFLIKNIDQWTNGRFRERVTEGIADLLDGVVHQGERYRPWKRAGELAAPVRIQKENIDVSVTTVSCSSFTTPPKSKSKRRRRGSPPVI